MVIESNHKDWFSVFSHKLNAQSWIEYFILFFHHGLFYDHVQNIIFVYVIFDLRLMEHGLAIYRTQVGEWRDLDEFGSQAHDSRKQFN